MDGLTFEDVDKLIARAVGEKTIYGDRDAAWIGVGSDGMLRISELAAVHVENIDFNANTLRIVRSKTDQLADGKDQFLTDRTLEHVRVWMARGKIESGNLFRSVNQTYKRIRKEGLTANSIRLILKKRAKAAGIEGRISGHSLRVGAAQSLAAMGATQVELQIAGRWTSPEMPAKYARKMSAQQSCVARLRNQ